MTADYAIIACYSSYLSIFKAFTAFSYPGFFVTILKSGPVSSCGLTTSSISPF